jgi:hypothetical protein
MIVNTLQQGIAISRFSEEKVANFGDKSCVNPVGVSTTGTIFAPTSETVVSVCRMLPRFDEIFCKPEFGLKPTQVRDLLAIHLNLGWGFINGFENAEQLLFESLRLKDLQGSNSISEFVAKRSADIDWDNIGNFNSDNREIEVKRAIAFAQNYALRVLRLHNTGIPNLNRLTFRGLVEKSIYGLDPGASEYVQERRRRLY